MEIEKDHVKTDSKRAYRSPQLTEFGSVASTTRVNNDDVALDNPTNDGQTSGLGTPPGNPILS
jgi:hypothetical protein